MPVCLNKICATPLPTEAARVSISTLPVCRFFFFFLPSVCLATWFVVFYVFGGRNLLQFSWRVWVFSLIPRRARREVESSPDREHC